MYLICCLPRGRPVHSDSPAFFQTWNETKRILVVTSVACFVLFGLAFWHDALCTKDFWAGLPALPAVAFLVFIPAVCLLGARPSEGGIYLCYKRLRLLHCMCIMASALGAITLLVAALTRYRGTAASTPLYVASGICSLVFGSIVLLFPTDPEAVLDDRPSNKGYSPPPSPAVLVAEAV